MSLQISGGVPESGVRNSLGGGGYGPLPSTVPMFLYRRGEGPVGLKKKGNSGIGPSMFLRVGM